MGDQVEGGILVDSTLKAVCDVSCPSTVPAAPSGATVTWDNAVTVGTVVTYTCSATDMKYAICGTDGTWTPSTIAECDAISATTSAPTAAPAAAPTAAPQQHQQQHPQLLLPSAQIKRMLSPSLRC